MEGKCDPAHIQRIGFFQSFNTPGDEITPRSDVVGKYFEDWFIHYNVPLLLIDIWSIAGLRGLVTGYLILVIGCLMLATANRILEHR